MVIDYAYIFNFCYTSSSPSLLPICFKNSTSSSPYKISLLPICCENSTHLEANHAFWQILGLYFLLPELSLLMNYFSAARVRDFELFWSDYFFSNQNYSYKMISIGNCTFMDFQPKMVEFFKTNFTLNFRSQISYLSAIRLFKGNGGSIYCVPYFFVYMFQSFHAQNIGAV